MGSWIRHFFTGNRWLENSDSVNDEKQFMKDISTWISIMDNHEQIYLDDGTLNGSLLNYRLRSMRNGFEFLGKLCILSIDRNLVESIKEFTVKEKDGFTTPIKNNVVMSLGRTDGLKGMMMRLVMDPANHNKSICIFQEKIHSTHNYRRIIDLLLENIFEVQRTFFFKVQSTPFRYNNATNYHAFEMVGELSMALVYYKPLYIYLAHPSCLYHASINTSLDYIINEAAAVIYLLILDKMDRDILVIKLSMIQRYLKACREFNIYVRFLKFGSSPFSSDVKGQFYILDNLIHILSLNSDSLNDANKSLYKKLKDLRTFVANPRRSGALNHYVGLTAATEAICYQAVQIEYSSYMKKVEPEENRKLYDILSVLGQIKMVKDRHGTQEIKLYEYPRVDALGFLEFFLGHLKDLQGYKKMSFVWTEIESLHMDIHSLVSSPKTSQEKLSSEELWAHIVRLAYQAEYVMDLYLVIPNSRCISTLSNIVEEVKQIKGKLLALPEKCHSAEDVAANTFCNVHGMPLEGNNVFIGFEEAVNSILTDLLGGENDLLAISIVGMAGAGKTSLAKQLFKESSLVRHFDRKAWCTVSQNYQTRDLLVTVLNQINPLESDIREMDEQELADRLCRSLKMHRYFIVIDDIWDVSLWKNLIRYFPNDQKKSRILITTRHHNVASETKSKIHELRALTENESWELLQKKLPQHESLPQTLLSIAKEVSKSCKGLPLSIVIVGGILQNAKRNEKMWNQIAKDVASTILSDTQGKCEDLLELSYSHLPNHLKSCILYLGLFLEDHEISVTRLVRLWIAEGLVRGGITSEECVEDVGKRYVADLITRSLVIPIKEHTSGGVQNFQLHDLLRDFFLKKAKEEHFLTVLDDRSALDLSLCPRRISINHDKDKHLPFISLNSIRTIISFCEAGFLDGEIERIMESKHMILLNVLDMHELMAPASYIHHFVHLRYLAIWKIQRRDQVLVLSTISTLWNLQTLILYFSNNQVWEVPDFIWDLVKLRHIHLLPGVLFPCPDSKRLEDSSVLLENLRCLSKPHLHYGDSNWLSRLPNLQKLSCIFLATWDDSLQQCRFPELGLCNRLTSVKAEIGVEGNERERYKLQFPASLRKLSLTKFILNSDDISGIGKSLPNLEVLKLHHSIENWIVNDEDFPELKVLKITGGNFNEWDASDESFPNLEQLWLQSCDSLKGIPLSFGDIPGLRIISTKDCNPFVSESAREIEKIQVEAQNLELKVNIESTNAYRYRHD